MHIKAEIEGLRALAIGSVFIFHIWPTLVPGGYVGVDVFFVISGYLITRHLSKEALLNGRISLGEFYARRIRRLLPAATLVLGAVVLLLPVLPQPRWEETLQQVAASALYIENWQLAWLAVDYLGAESAQSPVQHYWSLSIEEQFYIVLPILLISIAKFGSRRNLSRNFFLAILATAVCSFCASVYTTFKTPEAAYFVTYTRAWELAVGSLIAVVAMPALSNLQRESLRLAGLALIVAACFLFTKETRFPGYAALVPTIGCALVIIAGKNDRPSIAYSVLAAKPLQFIGGISYSIYLWHWPLTVYALQWSDDEKLSPELGLAVICLTMVASVLTKVFVEDPARSLQSRRAAYGIGAFSTLTVLAATVGMTHQIEEQGAADTKPDASLYVGWPALHGTTPPPVTQSVIPPLTQVRKDIPEAYRTGCHLGIPESDLHPCTYGDTHNGLKVYLVGDSHAANWIPAVARLTKERGWRMESHTKSGCPVLAEPVELRGGLYEACAAFGRNVIRHILASKPDLVLVSQSAGARLFQPTRPMEEVISSTWQPALDAGVRVALVADTPRHPFDPAECVQRDRNCHSPRSEVMRPDPLKKAIRFDDRLSLVDMNDGVCTTDLCPMVIGNIVVWRDAHHLTATYSDNLASLLGGKIDALFKAD